jgi:hypothetical protein
VGAKKLVTMLATAAAIAVAGITATGSMATSPKAATGSKLLHGPIEKVYASNHTFTMNDLRARGGKGRIQTIKATNATSYKRLSGFGALHKGLKVDVTSHHEDGPTWIADKIKKAPASPIPSGVTIHFRQPKKFVGFVFSKDPRVCASGRPVKLFRQKGKKQRPGRDHKIQQRTFASKVANGKYKWTVRRRPARASKYYARIGKFADCQKDTSKTIHVR